MRLLEYEAKELIAAHGAPIPGSQVITDPHDEATLAMPVVLKIQIPRGGRGKAGGVKIVTTDQEFSNVAQELLSKPFLGFQAKTLLAETALSIRRELYLAITLDRNARGFVVLAHKHGGVDIETAAG